MPLPYTMYGTVVFEEAVAVAVSVAVAVPGVASVDFFCGDIVKTGREDVFVRGEVLSYETRGHEYDYVVCLSNSTRLENELEMSVVVHAVNVWYGGT